MGTMFDIVAYHSSPADAERAVARALDEIVRLDQVLSHFKTDSDLSRLIREGRTGFASVDPSLFDVLEESIALSRRSGGKFDVTIAPVLRVWKAAHAEGRRPSPPAIANARRCVGYDKIEIREPNLIRLHAGCVEIDLGGIGKGYAVDRAIEVLSSAGIRHAMVNAGTSSIASIGAPPGQKGWPVVLSANVSGGRTILLRNESVSTARQTFVPLALEPGELGGILDPRTGHPIENRMTVNVVAPRATLSDALSTTLLMLSRAEADTLLGEMEDVSAMWFSEAGELTGAYRESRLQPSSFH